MRYFFILGNTPILSSAEIAAVFERQKIPMKWVYIAAEVAVVETAAVFDAKTLIRTLGGSVKIGRLLSSGATIEQWVRSRIRSDARTVLGVSVYRADDTVSRAECRRVWRDCTKKVFAVKREGLSLRLVTSRESVLSSVALVTEHVLERGGEFIVLVSRDGVQFGETLAVQAFHAYRHRDMGRPGRDARRGMLPPKVAQMMVNLARVPDGGTILDPFCGSGTILSEAALLGYRVIGSDIAKDAVDDARKNFQFLISNFQTNYQLPITNYQFFISDARNLPKHLAPHSIDAIVTEPYLGPPLTGREKPEQLAKIRQEVSGLVTDAFRSFRSVLHPDGRVVIILPVLGGQLLPIDDVQKLGWSIHTEGFPRMGGRSLTSRNTILYSRADQHLSREITIWTRI